METLFRKVLVSERVPSKSGSYDSDKGLVYFSHSRKKFENNNTPDDVNVEYWYETIHLPSEEEIFRNCIYSAKQNRSIYMDGCDYILGFINNKK